MVYTLLVKNGLTGNRLWSLVFVVMSLDVASTVAGLSLGLVEMNPVAVVGLDAVGVAALAVLKAPALAIGLVGWRTLSDPYRQLNLIGLAVPWLAAALTNCCLILATL